MTQDNRAAASGSVTPDGIRDARRQADVAALLDGLALAGPDALKRLAAELWVKANQLGATEVEHGETHCMDVPTCPWCAAERNKANLRPLFTRCKRCGRPVNWRPGGRYADRDNRERCALDDVPHDPMTTRELTRAREEEQQP